MSETTYSVRCEIHGGVVAGEFYEYAQSARRHHNHGVCFMKGIVHLEAEL